MHWAGLDSRSRYCDCAQPDGFASLGKVLYQPRRRDVRAAVLVATIEVVLDGVLADIADLRNGLTVVLDHTEPPGAA